jgi:xylan 1,4-beta-xylosidase
MRALSLWSVLLRLSTSSEGQGEITEPTATMVQQSRVAAAAALLSAAVSVTAQNSSFVCGGSGGASYNATKQYLGCYLDPSVSILGQAKISTIGMTPQYCANFCGSRGYAYGGVEFGT